MGDGGEDLGAVANDATLQRNERFDAAAPCPGDPTVQCLAGLVDGQFEDRAQAFLEQVGAVEPWVGFGDPRQLHPLAVGEVLRVLPQRVACASQCQRWSGGHGGASAMGPPVIAGMTPRAGGVPRLSTHGIECLGGPADDVKRVGAADGVGASIADHLSDPFGPVCADMGDWAHRPCPDASSASKKACTVARSRPGLAHTNRPLSWSTTTVRYLCRRLRKISSIPIRCRPANASTPAAVSAHTRVMIDATVRQAIRISSVIALLEHWVANQATC